MVARVAAAADQTDESRLVRQERFESLDEVLGVVIGVHRVDVFAQRGTGFLQGSDRGGPGGPFQPVRASLHQDRAESELRGQAQEVAGDRRRRKDHQGRRHGVWLDIDLDRPEVVPVGTQLRTA